MLTSPSRRWRFRLGLLVAFLPCVLGLLGLVVVFASDPLWPAQDMTPQMWADYHRAREEVALAYPVVGGLFVLSLLWLLFCGWWHLRRRRSAPTRPA